MVALSDLAIDEGATVVRLAAGNAADLRRLTQLGLLPGQFVRRRSSQPGSADVVVTIGRHERPLATTLAERVWTIRAASD